MRSEWSKPLFMNFMIATVFVHRRFVPVFLGVALVVAGCGGGGSSAPAAVTPPPPVVVAPTVGTQPQPVVVDDGAAATFSVTASGTAPLTYQWQRNGVAIAGANGASYTTAPLTPADSGVLFSVVVSNSGGSQTSQTATLTVKTLPPVIDLQPLATSATVGSDVTLKVHAKGSQPLSYQWFRSGILIAGATSDTLKVPSIPYADDGVGYSVQVSNSLATVASDVGKMTVMPALTPTVVSACGEITVGGSYVLKADIVTTDNNLASCIPIHDTSAVQLDCQGHAILRNSTGFMDGVSVKNVRNFSVKNCQLTTGNVNVDNSDSGTFSGNTISYPDTSRLILFLVQNTRRLVLDNNALTGMYLQASADSNTISNNRLVATTTSSSAVVFSVGVHTRIFNNTIDGAWDGNLSTRGQNGADEGIVLYDEVDALIENNQIQNVWDCGIESAGALTASTIRGNHIVRAAFCGIGGWYWSSLLGNTFSFNKVEKSGNLFEYEHFYALRPIDTMIYFKDNVFEGNQLIDPISRLGGILDYGMRIPIYDNMAYTDPQTVSPGETLPTASQFSYGNNLFKNNSFGLPAYAPWFGDKPVKPGLIIDGGGNVCPKPLDIYLKDYPLKCY